MTHKIESSIKLPKIKSKYLNNIGVLAILSVATFGTNANAQTTEQLPLPKPASMSPEEIDANDPFAVPQNDAPIVTEATVAPVSDLIIAPPPPPTKDSASIIQAGKLIFEIRPRYEYVDQTGIARKASSGTVRTRLGWETGAWNNMKGLIEFESVTQFSPERYNTTLNGKTAYPVVADPDVNEINRAQITWSNGPNLTVVAGRQRVNLDDQRFIGGVAWRQDEQTYDGLKTDFGISKLRGSYTFISRVNRVFAESLDWEGASHLLNLNYSISEPLKLQAFAYNLDFGGTGKTAPNLTAARNASTKTLGGRISGKVWADLVGVSYGLTYAKQQDLGPNPANFNLSFTSAELIGAFDIYTLRLNYEVAEGNGTRNFLTPLGTVHAFQGWADAFDLNNPTQVANGIKDLNLGLNLRPRWRKDNFFNMDATIRYHDFHTERTGIKIGTEIDAQFTASFTPQLSMIAKAAKFDGSTILGSGNFADRTKIWVGIEYKL